MENDALSFSTIGIERNEFFDFGYFQTKRVLLNIKNKSGVVFNHQSELLPKGHMFGSITVSYKPENASVALDRFGVKSDGRIILDAAMKLNQNLKLTVSAEDSRQEPGKPLHSFGKLGFEYKNNKTSVLPFVFANDVDVVNGPILRSSFVASIQNVLKFGVQGVINMHMDDKLLTNNLSNIDSAFNSSTPEIVDLSLTSAYKGDGWLASLKTRDYMKFMRVCYIQNISPTLDVGAQIDYGLKVNTQKFHVGAKLK